MAVVQVPPAVGTSGQFIDAVIITSSTLRQIIVVGDPATSGAFAPVTSSFGLLNNISSGSYLVRSLSSGTVTLSSNPTIISASSGLVQISGTVTILSASSGFVQTLIPINSSAGFGPVTSSAGVLASLSSGTITLSSNPTVVLSSPTSLSSGTVIMSSVQSVTATAGTNPWSSAPGFNVPVISASSGLIQALTSGTLIIVTVSSGFVQTLTSGPATISGTVTVVNTSSGLVQIIPQSSNAMTVFAYQSSSSANSTNAQSGATALFGYSVFNSTATIKYLKLYQTSSAPTLGSTASFLKTIMIPGSTGGAGANLISPIPMAYSTKGLGFTITFTNMSATDTGVGGTANDVEVNLYII